MTAAEVDAHFRALLGAPEAAFDAMRDMSITELEELQGVADHVSQVGRDSDARQKGFDWSVLIGSFIAWASVGSVQFIELEYVECAPAA